MSAKSIQPGDQIGKWRVLRAAPRRESNPYHRRWWCRCECGHERDVIESSLRRDSRSCGRCRSRAMKPGQRHHHWTLLQRVSGRTDRWRCRCDCGREREVSGASIRNGQSHQCQSCAHATHGLCRDYSADPAYKSWRLMMDRCHNPESVHYPPYGGRGISVCDEWRNDPRAFVSYMGQRPTPQHTVDRIDNDGNYEPGNVRWATPSEQARNRRSNRKLTVDGVTMTVAGWTERMGFARWTIKNRLRAGWSPERAVKTPVKKTRRR